MRLGILSDTHDKLARVRAAVAMFQEEGVDAIVHCGDFIGPEVLRACATILPCYYVFGNNDSDMVGELERAGDDVGATCLEWGGEVTLCEKRIGITHGHLHLDVRPLLAAEPDYLLSGHSHLTDDSMVGKTRRINPGALHRAKSYSVAVLDLKTEALQFLSVPR